MSKYVLVAFAAAILTNTVGYANDDLLPPSNNYDEDNTTLSCSCGDDDSESPLPFIIDVETQEACLISEGDEETVIAYSEEDSTPALLNSEDGETLAHGGCPSCGKRKKDKTQANEQQVVTDGEDSTSELMACSQKDCTHRKHQASDDETNLALSDDDTTLSMNDDEGTSLANAISDEENSEDNQLVFNNEDCGCDHESSIECVA